MHRAYLLLKFLHVLAAAVWIGGLLALVVLNARLGREGDAAMLAALGQQSGYFGRTVLGPAMVVTLLAGLATSGVVGFPFSTLWIAWGLFGFVVSIAVGVIAVERAARRPAAGRSAASTDRPERGRSARVGVDCLGDGVQTDAVNAP